VPCLKVWPDSPQIPPCPHPRSWRLVPLAGLGSVFSGSIASSICSSTSLPLLCRTSSVPSGSDVLIIPLGASLSRVCCHNFRAIMTGSSLTEFHHAASSPHPWSTRWWVRQRGTANSSLTLRRSAGCANRKGGASDGRRPHRRHGCERHELQVRTIAVAARFAQCKNAFVDMPCNGIIHTLSDPDLTAGDRTLCSGAVLLQKLDVRAPSQATLTSESIPLSI
jgi:hypothetical protein